MYKAIVAHLAKLEAEGQRADDREELKRQQHMIELLVAIHRAESAHFMGAMIA